MSDTMPQTVVCPLPTEDAGKRVTLAHGEGGRQMRQFIARHILPAFENDALARLGDAAVLKAADVNAGDVRLAFTTDSYVVSPLFFPGGDIGRLAVLGTVNDLAVSGARPRWISLSLILEEGLPLATLDRVLASAAAAARDSGVQIVTGDTKVVPRGAADGLFINTAGIGTLEDPVLPGPAALAPGDVLLVSGPVGRHGIAVLAARESLFAPPLPESDCGELYSAVAALRLAGVPLKALRDATRGGAAAVLHEWAHASGHTLSVEEAAVPVTPQVRGACELLGLDPLFVANEGTLLAAVPAAVVDAALEALRSVPTAAGAAVIGAVRPRGPAAVTIRRGLRREAPLDEPWGAPLPRIC